MQFERFEEHDKIDEQQLKSDLNLMVFVRLTHARITSTKIHPKVCNFGVDFFLEVQCGPVSVGLQLISRLRQALYIYLDLVFSNCRGLLTEKPTQLSHLVIGESRQGLCELEDMCIALRDSTN